jgi:DNA-binding MarR family transcriptional regulator
MNTTPPTSYDLAAGMRSAIGRLSRGLRQTGVGKDLSPSQNEVFGVIARAGDIRLSDLAELEGLNPTLLSRIVGKLETAGLVKRVPDPEDRRVAHAVPTARGRKVYEQMRTARTDALNLAIGELTEAERDALEAALPVIESLSQTLKHRGPR